MVVLDDFERSNVDWDFSDWTVSINSNQAKSGSSSMYLGGNNGGAAAYNIFPGYSGGARPSYFRFYFYETINSTGHGIRLRNSNGNYECGAATDNPEWNYSTGGSTTTELGTSDGSYNTWHQVDFDFRWGESEVDITFTKPNGDSFGIALLPINGVDIERVELWPHNQDQWDSGNNNKDGWVDLLEAQRVFSRIGQIDGQFLSDITIDGETVYEATIDGQVIYSDSPLPTPQHLFEVETSTQYDLDQLGSYGSNTIPGGDFAFGITVFNHADDNKIVMYGETPDPSGGTSPAEYTFRLRGDSTGVDFTIGGANQSGQIIENNYDLTQAGEHRILVNCKSANVQDWDIWINNTRNVTSRTSDWDGTYKDFGPENVVVGYTQFNGGFSTNNTTFDFRNPTFYGSSLKDREVEDDLNTYG